MPLDTPDLTEFSTASPVIATFGFTDIASGLGYSNFIMNIFIDIADEKTSIFLDAEVRLGSLSINNTQTGIIDTGVFNLVRVVQGDVYFTYTMNSPAVGTRHVVTLFHVDSDNNETQLGDSWETRDNVSTCEGIITVTRQNMEVGSKLRLKLLAVGNNTISNLNMSIPFEVTI